MQLCLDLSLALAALIFLEYLLALVVIHLYVLLVLAVLAHDVTDAEHRLLQLPVAESPESLWVFKVNVDVVAFYTHSRVISEYLRRIKRKITTQRRADVFNEGLAPVRQVLHELKAKLSILLRVLLNSTGATRVALPRLFEDIVLRLTPIRLHILRLSSLLGLDIYVLDVASLLLSFKDCRAGLL